MPKMACMDDDQLAGIADTLYSTSLDDFVAVRAAAAKAAAAGDKALGAAVLKLPKPSVAAWAVNMLARDKPDVLAGLADLGHRMQAAQANLDAAALRGLARERRTLLAAAVDIARTVSTDHGRTISGAMATDVEETLRALTADPGAAGAVRSGLLLKTLAADGVNAVDLDGATAVPGATAPAGVSSASRAEPASDELADTEPLQKRPTPEPAKAPARTKPRLEAVRQTPRAASAPALDRAKESLARARAEEARTAQLAADLLEQSERSRATVADLETETGQLRSRLKEAEEQLAAERKALAAGAAEAKQAARAAAKAERTAMLAQERVLRLGNTRD